MNSVLILSCAVLLFIPGPTNILLFNAGARQGFRKAYLLMIAEWGGYLFSITSWSAVTFILLSAGSSGVGFFRLLCAGYLFFLAVKIWQSEINTPGNTFTPGAIFLTTVMNPKALIFASVVFPENVVSSPGGYTMVFLNFTVVVLTASGFWISLGVMIKRRNKNRLLDFTVRSFSSLALMSFGIFMLYSTFQHHPVT